MVLAFTRTRATTMAALSLVLLTASQTAAAPLSVSDARAHLAAGRIDEIYLAWASLDAGAHPEGDAAAAEVLVEAAVAANAEKDFAVGLGLAETASRLRPASVPAALALAEAALALEQPGAAARALDGALGHAPRDARLLMRRAELAEREAEPERAIALYRRVPRKSAEGREARRAIARLERELAEEKRALAEADAIARDLRRKQEAAARTAGEGEPLRGDDPSIGSTSEESTGVAGMVARKSDHFRIVYARGDRDFAERARFESKVLGMFEKAYEKIAALVDYRPRRVFEVVLYTAEEFELHFGGQMAGGVLGFYAGKIRMNRSENLDDQYWSTVVHELTHAFVDDMAGGRGGGVGHWFNEGFAEWTEWELTRGGDRVLRKNIQLRSARRYGRRMSLASLQSTPFGRLGGAAGPAYLKSRAAIEVLIGTGGGLARIREVCELVGSGRPFQEALVEAFGQSTVDGLEDEANEKLSRL